MKLLSGILVIALFITISCTTKTKENPGKEKEIVLVDNEDSQWEYLLDTTLSKWEMYLGYPQDSQKVEGLKRDETGKYLEPIGKNKNLNNNFSVIAENDEPVLRISGEYYGCVATKQEFENYHLSLRVKWGTLKWEPRLDKPMDSGILYHSIGEYGVDYWRSWMLSQEMQVVIDETHKEGMGDYWSIANSEITIRATPVEEGEGYVFNPEAEPVHFEGSNNFCYRKGDYNKENDWDTLELITYNGNSLHIVNGHVVMALTDSRYKDENGSSIPLTKGKIQIQSEAAEVFYKDIKIKKINNVPSEYIKYFQ